MVCDTAWKIRGFFRAITFCSPQWNAVHSFIKVNYKCEKCYDRSSMIFDYTTKGVRARYGYYAYTTSLGFYGNENLKGLDLEDVLIRAQNIRKNGSYYSQDYGTHWRNCQHFADDLWKKLLENKK